VGQACSTKVSVKAADDSGLPDVSWHIVPKRVKSILHKLPLNFQTIHVGKIDQMTVKYTSIFYSKALQNLPKLGFFCLKIFHLATLVEMEVSFSVESHFF
jgi:hypothetical protein